MRQETAVSMPQKLRDVRPMYTADAVREKVKGAVLLHGVVEATGKVSSIRVIRRLHDGLDAETAHALAQWEFQPGLRGGVPVAVAITAEFHFTTASHE